MGTLLGDNELVGAALSDVLSLSSRRREELDPAGLIDDLIIRHHLLQVRLPFSIITGMGAELGPSAEAQH
jgi:hypothetical protein